MTGYQDVLLPSDSIAIHVRIDGVDSYKRFYGEDTIDSVRGYLDELYKDFRNSDEMAKLDMESRKDMILGHRFLCEDDSRLKMDKGVDLVELPAYYNVLTPTECWFFNLKVKRFIKGKKGDTSHNKYVAFRKEQKKQTDYFLKMIGVTAIQYQPKTGSKKPFLYKTGDGVIYDPELAKSNIAKIKAAEEEIEAQIKELPIGIGTALLRGASKSVVFIVISFVIASIVSAIFSAGYTIVLLLFNGLMAFARGSDARLYYRKAHQREAGDAGGDNGKKDYRWIEYLIRAIAHSIVFIFTLGITTILSLPRILG